MKAQYTVIWWQPALDDLAMLWVDASDREAVTATANEIDRVLAAAPSNKGIAVREGLRKLSVEPLEVQFSVEEDDCRVIIWSVRRTRDESKWKAKSVGRLGRQHAQQAAWHLPQTAQARSE